MNYRKNLSEIWLTHSFSKDTSKHMFRVEAAVPVNIDMPEEYTPTGSYDSVGRKYYFSAWFFDIKKAEEAAFFLVAFLSSKKARPMMFREIRKPQHMRL